MTLSPIGICSSGPHAAAIAMRLAASGTRVIVHGFEPPQPPHPASRPRRIERAANLFDLGSECEAIVVAYPSHDALREALVGTEERPGLLGALAPGSLIADLSHGPPEETRRLAGQLAGRAIGLVELAIAGPASAIASGHATIYAGGYGEHVATLAAALAPLGPMTRVGPQGSARLYLALSEAVRAAHVLAMEDAQRMAAASGFVPEPLATPPLSPAERRELAAHVADALAWTAAADAPVLAALPALLAIGDRLEGAERAD